MSTSEHVNCPVCGEPMTSFSGDERNGYETTWMCKNEECPVTFLTDKQKKATPVSLKMKNENEKLLKLLIALYRSSSLVASRLRKGKIDQALTFLPDLEKHIAKTREYELEVLKKPWKPNKH